MKRLSLFAVPVLVFILTAFHNIQDSTTNRNKDAQELPENIHAIFKRSCFDCHAKGSKNFYAKGKLNFDHLNELTDVKKISVLNNILQKIETNEMPPEKYIKRNPDKKITKKEEEAINQWVKTELQVIKENINND